MTYHRSTEYHSNLFCQQYKLNYRQSRYARRGMERGVDRLDFYRSKDEAFNDVYSAMAPVGLIGLILSAFLSAFLSRLAQMIVDYLWDTFDKDNNASTTNSPHTIV